MDNLRKKVLKALGWAVGAKFGGQIISWVITIVVIRMLTPEDYGLMAIATIFISLLSLMSELGLGAAIVQHKSLNDSLLKSIFGFVIVTNVILFFTLYYSSSAIAYFFEDDRLSLIIEVLAFRFLIMAFEVVPLSLLERKLDFKGLSIVELLSVLGGAFVTLFLAYSDYGVWALVWGHLASALFKTVGMVVISPQYFMPSFKFKGIFNSIKFGGMITIDRIVWFIYTQADIVIIGKVLSKDLLGYYSVAVHLASLPMQKTQGILHQIAFPAYSQIQNNLDDVSYYLKKTVRIISIFSFPIFWGMSSVADPLVSLVLGDKWEPVGLYLQLLCLIMPLQMMGSAFTPVLQGIGKPEVGVINLLYALVIMPTAFIIGVQWGVLGVVVSWLVAYPIVFSIYTVRSLSHISLPVREYLNEVKKPLLASIAMYVAVMLTQHLSDYYQVITIVNFIASIAIGGVIYIGVIWVAHRDAALELVGLLRK
ncbi:MAG: lipopolysaccharide biosynthesis protein [Thiohalomonadales bacterium]